MIFKFYIFISLIIHLIALFFTPINLQKERLKGEKITPIEIINNKSFNSSKGNTNKNSTKKIPKKSQDIKKKEIRNYEKIKKTNDIKLNNKNQKVRENSQIKKKEIIEKFENKVDKNFLKKEKNFDTSKISNPQKIGVSDIEDIKEKEKEKGSIKGKGKLKITCLNCISPKYPRKALKKGLEGKPKVKVWILKSGEVEKAEIIFSSGITSIDDAALEAAKKSSFYPLPFNSFINIEYDLKLR